MDQIHLLSPYIHERMEKNVIDAISSGWITTKGPQLDEFESNLKEKFGFSYLSFTNSGTAALHVTLAALNIGKGDLVLISDVSFCAVANVVLYQQAEPVFIDCDTETWGIDPDILASYLATADTTKIKALILVHLYGNPAQIQKIKLICHQYKIILIEDAAEALGSKVDNQFCGTIGDIGIISFNGNKILTTGGGGAVISQDEKFIDRVKYLSNQAKSSSKNHYWHEEVGFNYGLSNISASVGIGQLYLFDEILQYKEAIHNRYRAFSERHKNLSMAPLRKGIISNNWLNTIIINDERTAKIDWNDLLDFFWRHKIEVRRFWTPLHLQPAYNTFEYVSNGVGNRLFSQGLCLPSSPNLTIGNQNYIIDLLEDYLTGRGLLQSHSLGI
ncbi:MAG: aminotransferase class V-fold PLP-dependent enzyme [Cyclobacteriaceae bacterium]